uniref:Uncharacterized protein n=1 Tax=Cacopsylla melanoneura TaxID=428564 RepID=A0A8D8PQV9_9HEMI
MAIRSVRSGTRSVLISRGPNSTVLSITTCTILTLLNIGSGAIPLTIGQFSRSRELPAVSRYRTRTECYKHIWFSMTRLQTRAKLLSGTKCRQELSLGCI